MTRPLSAALAAGSLAIAFVLTACTAAPVDGGEDDAATAAPAGEGSFVVVYEDATSAETQTEQDLWQSAALLETFAEWMNETVAIPSDVQVVAEECGEANAFYSAENSTIQLCYELGAAERTTLVASGAEIESIDEELLESALATLFHEGGHALLAELALDFTGREEDVADQFSVWALSNSDEDADSLITVAELYYLNAETVTDVDELPFEDTHALDAQRSANFLCYVYGAYPDTYEYLVTDGTLPEDRASGCEEEYQQLSDGWTAVLEPHLR